VNDKESACTAAKCSWNSALGACRKVACSHSVEANCKQDGKCGWSSVKDPATGVVTGECSVLDQASLLAAAQASPYDDVLGCKVTTKNLLNLGILMGVLTLILLIAFVWMWRRQAARLKEMGGVKKGFDWGGDENMGEGNNELEDRLVNNANNNARSGPTGGHARTDSL